ncbi:MAG: serine hydrolase [Segetibacter sp.]|nr:serine hydrolase [Segetibacter sp.]
MPASQINVLEGLLTNEASLKQVVANKDSFNLQIIYTRIDRNANNKPRFTDYTFNVSPDKYFYPASTVKMPFAFLALEKLNELKRPGVNKFTTMITDSSYAKEQVTYSNPMAEDCRPSIAHYIKQVFLVSDNEAANRIYEFLGQNYLNRRLIRKGYKDVDIRNRLNIALTENQNRHTNPVSFVDSSGSILYQQAGQFNQATFKTRNDKFGKGFYKGGSLINEPFDFSTKNKISLINLHNILRSVIFPGSVALKRRFNLSKDDYRFLYQYMSSWPRESKFPAYDTANYHDAYAKFLMYGSEKGTLPGNIRIFNKIGDAYGFLNDIAYIADFENKIEFMLSCSILCNTDGIFNDDKYDYETIGFPFMKNLGQVIYNYEKQRLRKHHPDLSRFVIDYSR